MGFLYQGMYKTLGFEKLKWVEQVGPQNLAQFWIHRDVNSSWKGSRMVEKSKVVV